MDLNDCGPCSPEIESESMIKEEEPPPPPPVVVERRPVRKAAMKRYLPVVEVEMPANKRGRTPKTSHPKANVARAASLKKK